MYSRFQCQQQRSLDQNRKIARKLLRQKLDEYYNPGNSVKAIREAIGQRKLEQKKEKTRVKLEKLKLEKAEKSGERAKLKMLMEGEEATELKRLQDKEFKEMEQYEKRTAEKDR